MLLCTMFLHLIMQFCLSKSSILSSVSDVSIGLNDTLHTKVIIALFYYDERVHTSRLCGI